MRKKILTIVSILFGIGLIAFFMLKNNNVPLEENLLCHFDFQETLTMVHGKKINIPIISTEKMKTIELRIGDSVISKWMNPAMIINYEFNSIPYTVGMLSIVLVGIDKNGKEIKDERVIQILSDIIPKKWTIKIIAEFPHLDSNFTQGLAFSGNSFFESTGDPNSTGSTLVGEIDLLTGKIKRRVSLDAAYFGEGITVLDKKIYQITWKNQTCFVYNEAAFSKDTTFSYPGEGWGICNDGKSLIMSDGTERLIFRNPKTFEVQKTISAYTNEGPISNLNELEFIDGLIYSNIWITNLVAVIDPQNGKVIAIIDASELVIKGKGKGEVLNGIAYNNLSKKIYMTGKYWPKLFEISLVKTLTKAS
jgi:glutamine cyclotransferase